LNQLRKTINGQPTQPYGLGLGGGVLRCLVMLTLLPHGRSSGIPL
jgi:hypothetical protein